MSEEKQTDLETKVNDKQSKGFIRKTFDLGFNLAIATATTALGFATVGTTAPLIATAFAGGGLIGGIVKKKKSGESLYTLINNALKTYSAVNTVVYPMVLLGDYTFPIAGKIGANIFGANLGPYIGRTAYALSAYNAVFTALFRGARHLYDNKFDPTGIGKAISTNFWASSNRIALLMAPAYGLVANGIPFLNIANYKLPAFAVNALPASYLNEVLPSSASIKAEKNHNAAAFSNSRDNNPQAKHMLTPNRANYNSGYNPNYNAMPQMAPSLAA